MQEIVNRKIFSGTRGSQRLSNNFKSVSRDKGPAWSRRFVKDHYDLVYDVDPYSIGRRFAKKKQIKPSVNQNNTIQLAIKKYQYSPYKARQMPKSSQSHRGSTAALNPQHYRTNCKQYQKQIRNFQQTASTDKKERQGSPNRKMRIQQFDEAQRGQKQQGANKYYSAQNITEGKALSKINLMGISPFQFQNTIKGKIMSKSNNHLDFSKSKTQKMNNIIHKWYDYSKDIQKDQIVLQREKYKVSQSIHPFKCYSAHKLFQRDRRFEHGNGCGHGGQLDQFYQIARPQTYDFNHAKTNKNKVDYTKMTERSDLPNKLGTNLQYNDVIINKPMGLLNGKKPILSMCKSQRKLVIGRQVISPQRGCYK